MAARVLVLMGLLLLGLLTSAAHARAAASSNRASSFIRKGDLPETGAEWISLHETVEFMPSSSEFDMSMLPRTFGTGQLNQLSRQRKLDQYGYEEDEQDDTTYQNRLNNPQYRVQPFVEGVSDYDEYQQAWRLLGFMIDCDDGSTDDDGGSGSEDDYDTGLGCARYVVWAAVSVLCCAVLRCYLLFRLSSQQRLVRFCSSMLKLAWILSFFSTNTVVLVFAFFLNSTSTSSTKGAASVNTNTTIAKTNIGMTGRANTQARTGVPKWTVTSKTHTFLSWDSSNTSTTTIGWSSYSSTRDIVFGPRKSTPL